MSISGFAERLKACGPSEQTYWAVFCVLALISGWTLFGFRYLPMMDLPQHVAAVSIMANYSDPVFRFSEFYDLNWFSPYLLGYLPAVLLAKVMDPVNAVKVVLLFACVCTPVAFRALLGALNRNIWWSLGGFALFFNYPYYWGLYSYLVAFPVSLAVLALLLRNCQRRDNFRLAQSAVALIMLFFVHGVAFALTCLIAVSMIFARQPTIRGIWRTLLPFFPACVVAILWRSTIPGHFADQSLGDFANFDRFWALPGLILEKHGDLRNSVGCMFFLVAVIAVTGIGFSRKPKDYIPLGISMALFALLPDNIYGTALMGTRLNIYIYAFLTLVLVEGPQSRRFGVPAVVAASVCGLLVYNWYRSHEFQVEFGDVEAIQEAIEPGSTIRMIQANVRTQSFSGPYKIHAAGYLQALRGGLISGTFGQYFMHLESLRPGITPHFRDAEYYLVAAESGEAAITASTPQVDQRLRVVAGKGLWWVLAPDTGSEARP